MPAIRFQRSSKLGVVVVIATLGVVTTACGRSSQTPTGGTSSAATQSLPGTSSSPAQAAGDFGTLKKICGPGPGTAGSGRGIEGKTIRLGVLADPGAAAAPGLGQEFFDVADAFSKWCNAAGGINGRQIVIDKLDAKLFNGASVILQACQKDFMLVGGENAFDAVDVKPRVACKLGAVSPYSASPQATEAALQVSVNPSVPTRYGVAPLRLLAEAYPATKQALGIGSTNYAAIAPQGLRAQEAYQKLGFKVTVVQPRPIQVDNYRPWMAQLSQSGAKADFEITAQDPGPIFNGMNDTGFKPQWVAFGSTFYSEKSAAAAKSAAYLPNSFVGLAQIPWELADNYPVVAQAKSILLSSKPSAALTSFANNAFDAWTLWASSATACGANLTQDCVLQKAGSQTNWDAGGLVAPINTSPVNPQPTNCQLLVRLTRTGWVYDKKVTQPNNGLYNCSADNVITTKSYQSGS